MNNLEKIIGLTAIGIVGLIVYEGVRWYQEIESYPNYLVKIGENGL